MKFSEYSFDSISEIGSRVQEPFSKIKGFVASIEPMQTEPLRPTFLAVYYQNINKEETAVWHDNDKKIQRISEGRKTTLIERIYLLCFLSIWCEALFFLSTVFVLIESSTM